jgi:hypothetical protein
MCLKLWVETDLEGSLRDVFALRINCTDEDQMNGVWGKWAMSSRIRGSGLYGSWGDLSGGKAGAWGMCVMASAGTKKVFGFWMFDVLEISPPRLMEYNS